MWLVIVLVWLVCLFCVLMVVLFGVLLGCMVLLLVMLLCGYWNDWCCSVVRVVVLMFVLFGLYVVKV